MNKLGHFIAANIFYILLAGLFIYLFVQGIIQVVR